MDPDAKTRDLVESIQASVDDLISVASEGGDASSGGQHSVVDDRLRRFGGRFSKHMEALSAIDKEVGDLLFKMVSALSKDDVIRQRLEHVLHCVHALQVSLAYVLIDFKPRFNLSEVKQLKKDLLSYTYQLYTSQDEKKMFSQIFSIPEGEAEAEAKSRFTS